MWVRPGEKLRTAIAVALVAISTLFAASFAAAEENAADPLSRGGPKILFLGDSITANGFYVAYIDTWLMMNEPAGKRPNIIDLGLASETTSGLSEEGHPFPRPCIHDRLDRVLDRVKPDIVVACYGINCGIYHPFSKERFEKYTDGMTRLIEKSRAAGASVILFTPPPYAAAVTPPKEPAPGDHGFRTPYEDYDQVMTRYAEWVKSLAGQNGIRVVDIRTPLTRHMDACYDNDPIHPNPTGHEVMAEAFLKAWGAKTGAQLLATGQRAHADDADWDEVFKLVRQRHLTYDRALLDDIGHTRPGTKAKHELPEATRIAGEMDEQISKLLPVGRKSSE